MPTIPTFKGWSVSKAEAPIIVHAAGIPAFSTTAFNSSSAFPKITPCPQTINGFFAEFISSAASFIAFSSGFGVGL